MRPDGLSEAAARVEAAARFGAAALGWVLALALAVGPSACKEAGVSAVEVLPRAATTANPGHATADGGGDSSVGSAREGAHDGGAALGAPERRLTRFELAYAIEDVFGVNASALHALPGPRSALGDVPDIQVGRLLDASEDFLVPYRKTIARLARTIAARLAPPCKRAGPGMAACVARRLREPAARLWRATLEDGEVGDLVARPGAAGAGEAKARFQAGVTALLDSPRFYLVGNEAVPAAATPAAKRALEQRRLVTRLALVLWSSVPDAELLRKAESGAFGDPARLATEIRRMMADARFRRLAREFTRQWLRLDRRPAFRPSLTRRGLVNDPRRLAEAVDEAALFVQQQVTMGRPIEEMITSNSPGLLTSIAVLGAVSSELRGGGDESWLGRGLTVQSSFLCRTFPLAAVYPGWLWEHHPLLEGDKSEGSKRPGEPALLAIRTRDRPCRECHGQLETIGAVLATFDGFGRLDPSAKQKTVEVAGESITGSRELAAWISSSGRFQPCLAQKLLTYALGRAVAPAKRSADRCLVRALTTAGGADRPRTLSAWLESILGSAAFRAQGSDVVRDSPNPAPNSNAYKDALPPISTSSTDCHTFDAGPFLVENCGTSACHGPGGDVATFAVADTAKAKSLLQAARPSRDGYCQDHAGLIDRTKPAASLVIRKLTAGADACGAPMPITGGPRTLDPKDHACFVRWAEEIARGL